MINEIYIERFFVPLWFSDYNQCEVRGPQSIHFLSLTVGSIISQAGRIRSPNKSGWVPHPSSYCYYSCQKRKNKKQAMPQKNCHHSIHWRNMQDCLKNALGFVICYGKLTLFCLSNNVFTVYCKMLSQF